MSHLTDEVRQWISHDPDAGSRAELQALLSRADAGGADGDAALADLADRFVGPLEFGTAGLRGKVGAGPNRMNRAVVIRTAAGLMRYLLDAVAPDPVIVVGYDARNGSARFAQDTAAVAVAAGGRAVLLPAPLPTPLLAFAVRHLGADAGVMVTASHNPKDDNGYKVYLGGRAVRVAEQGTQIVPPYDAEIAERIAKAPAANLVPQAKDGWEVLGDELRAAYLERLRTSLPSPDGEAPGALRIVLTPMHGVGGETCRRALADAGFHDVHLVPRQAEPDPAFPTVAFPNPEEPGALDLAVDFARAVDADLIIANDPDADRCAAAVPDVTAPTGWRLLTGDEVGSLLGDQAARVLTGEAAVAPSAADAEVRPALANSVVSSRLLSKIADSYGLAHQVTLTGFKWIARAPGLVFGYEEAIGYCVDPDGVRDKDGISAAVRLAQLADVLRRRGRSIPDRLDDFAREFGVHHTAQLSVRVEDLTLIGLAMERLRTTPPHDLAGSPVSRVQDLAEGSADLPPTDGMEFRTEADDRVVVRPSGTEPKLKCYLEVIVPVEDGTAPSGAADEVDPVAAARTAAAARMVRLRADVAAAIGMG